MKLAKTYVSIFMVSLFTPSVIGAEEASSTEESAISAEAQANNPLADVTAFNIQNYYIGGLTESDEDANQFWLRYAKPLNIGESTWLLRASLPVNSFPDFSGNTNTGIGDLNIFAAKLIDIGNPAISFGVGPQLTAPTASDSKVGSEKWSAGLANVMFNASSPKFQYGYLATWQASFAGDDSRNEVNVGALQPFAFYQLQEGWYLRSAPIWAYNFESDSYNMPLGLGLGKVIKRDEAVYNMFVEPQYSVAHRGAGQPEWQIYFALNLQF